MSIVAGSTVVVRKAFAEYDLEEGYLVLRPGQTVVVLFVGSNGEERGWLFGHEPGSPHQGWFPLSAVSLPEASGFCINAPAAAPTPAMAVRTAGCEQGSLVGPPPGGQPPPPSSGSQQRPAVCASQNGRVPAPPPPEPVPLARVDHLHPQPSEQRRVPGGVEGSAAASWLGYPESSSVPPPPAQLQQVPPTPVRPPPVTPPPEAKPLLSRAPPPPPPEPTPVSRIAPPPPQPQAASKGLPLPPPPPPPESTEPAALVRPVCVDATVDLPALPEPGFDRRRGATGGEALIAAARRGVAAGEVLPMASLRGELLGLVERHRVIIIDAATGSGKSTLVPLYLAEQCLALGRDCRIVVTQPRRLAAKGLAKRVSDQSQTPTGELAGFRVGNSREDRRAPIVYVTAGHLLEALVHNPRHLDSFSHVVLDEVHERFVEADFLMALLRLALSRPETIAMRIVVMSATLQKALGVFFRPLFLPAPAFAEPAMLRLPGATPYAVEEFQWETLKARWPDIFIAAGKEPPFLEQRPSKAKFLPPQRRSDQLTKLCKDLAPFCAQVLCELRFQARIALVFLPGLDQMKEVQGALAAEVNRRQGRSGWEYVAEPSVFLMHSALEEDTYREALNEAPEGEWRVVLATNIAESSLTVPGVSAIIDFGMHRVSNYNDEVRMSMLMTEWCSKASMKQRRGRTGRTNPGCYIQLFPQCIRDDLLDFDESGVERSPLTRVTLEAAHLAELLGDPPSLRAGLPVAVDGEAELSGAWRDGAGILSYWDGPSNGWRVEPSGASSNEDGSGGATLPEALLTPMRVEARHVLAMLPTPPKEDRVQSAMLELHELGALTARDMPSVLGTACLKLPVDAPLGRLVVFGWALGRATDAVVLAAALSLAPSCDVLRTPFNTRNTLEPSDLKLLRQVVDLRRHHDGGSLSEPLTVYSLCAEWLRAGGGSLGGAPKSVSWRSWVHVRVWTQFTEKLVELTEALLRLIPAGGPGGAALEQLLRCARGRSSPCPALSTGRSSRRHLAALLAWALAPEGFVAVGQTPALYGGGLYDVFKKVVREHQGVVANTLWWPKVPEAGAREVAQVTNSQVRWSAMRDHEAFLGIEGQSGPGSAGMPAGSELLCRICCPFNGKETFVSTQGTRMVPVRPPRHPCTLNWYMPRRDGLGMIEVMVGWQSQAETLLNVPRPGDRRACCRPKRFLVASGGRYQSVGGRRNVVLRGITALPAEDGGRSALLWLLAAGLPREGNFVALMAPGPGKTPGDFEMRALRLWQRTFCLPREEPLTAGDLQVVNAFRCALLELQQRKPHRLAGAWRVVGSGEERHIECLEPAASSGGSGLVESEDVLVVDGGSAPLLLRGCRSGLRWREELPGDAGPGGLLPSAASPQAPQVYMDEEAGGGLLWSDGSRWVRAGGEDSASQVLGALGPETLGAFKRSAETLLSITEADEAEVGHSGHRQAPRWLARLVPVLQGHAVPESGATSRGRSCLAPLDLAAAEATMAAFSAKLDDQDFVESDTEVADEDEEGSDDDDFHVDVSQEGVNEEYMWRLAEDEDFAPSLSRNLCFVESALALPPSPICVECEREEGIRFSKSQLGRHPEDRRCEECVAKSMATVYRPATIAGPVSAVGPPQPPPPPVAGGVAATLIGGGTTSQAPLCSICRIQLNKQNCSSAQRQKAPTRRRCNGCVSKGWT